MTTKWSVPTWGGPTKWTTNEINFSILRYFRSRKKDSFVRGFAWPQKHAGDQKHTKILARKVTISLAAGRKTENILTRKEVRVAQPLFLFVYHGSRILQIELSVRLQWIWNYSSINQSTFFTYLLSRPMFLRSERWRVSDINCNIHFSLKAQFNVHKMRNIGVVVKNSAATEANATIVSYNYLHKVIKLSNYSKVLFAMKFRLWYVTHCNWLKHFWFLELYSMARSRHVLLQFFKG